MKKLLFYFIITYFNSSTYLQAQWLKQAVNTEASFRTVCAVSDKTVWISGSKGTVIKTADGGKTWQIMRVEDGLNLDFRDIHAFNDSSAIVVSAGEAEAGNAKIFITEDGGKNWRIVYQTIQKGVFLDGIDFWDANNGIAFSDPIDGKFFIIKTTDGGKTWFPINADNIAENQPNEAAFAASGTSLITVGKDQAFICTGGGMYARVYRSTNQGKNWEVVSTNLPAGKTSGLFGLRFWDKKNGIAVGGDYQDVSKAVPNVVVTQDGGKTWQDAIQTQPVGLKEGVAIFKKKILIAVGPSGTCYSKDFGKSWTEIDKSPFHAIAVFGNNIWAVGGKGNIAKLSLSSLK
jgi:photosystem II stability/assembly factor-like uncharacterized protein